MKQKGWRSDNWAGPNRERKKKERKKRKETRKQRKYGKIMMKMIEKYEEKIEVFNPQRIISCFNVIRGDLIINLATSND